MTGTVQHTTIEDVINNYLTGGVIASTESEEVVVADQEEGGIDPQNPEPPTEIDLNDETTPDVAELAPATDDTVTMNTPAILVEASDELEAAKSISTEIKSDVENVASMETLYNILNQSLQTGGLTQIQSVMANNIALMCQNQKNGLAVSTESFGGVLSKEAATIASMEGIVDFIRGVKESIKAKLSALRKRFKNWWIRTWDGSVSIRKRAKKLQENIPTDNTTPFARELSAEDGYFKLLSIDDTPQGGEKLVSHLEFLGKVGNAILSEESLKKIVDECKRSIKVAIASPDQAYAAGLLEPSKVWSCIQPTKNKFILEGIKNRPLNAYATPTLLGDVAIGCYRIDPSKPNPFKDKGKEKYMSLFSTVKSYTYEYEEYTVDANGHRHAQTKNGTVETSGGSIEAARRDHIVKLLKTVIDISQYISDYNMSWEKQEEVMGNYFANIDKEMKDEIRAIGHSLDADEYTQEAIEDKLSSMVDDLAYEYFYGLQSAMAIFIQHTEEVLNEVINYCALSIHNLTR